MNGAILQAEAVSLDYRLGAEWVNAVREVSLTVRAGEIHGLVGESGSGKSTLALALMGYLPPNSRASSGRVLLEGEDLLALDPAALRARWGAKVSLVPQDALASLNPSQQVGEQIAEVLRRHQKLDRASAHRRAVDMLNAVRIAEPAATARKYPHQLSGGMQQRVMIAMALAARPRLIILDEPTTALDVTTQAAILSLLRDLVRDEGAAAVYVSHDLALVARLCDPITVLYGGEVMESGAARQILGDSHHPYTLSLIRSLPRLATNPDDRLPAIAGSAPSLTNRPPACVFAGRCPVALPRCHAEKPPQETAGDGRRVTCWRWRELADGTLRLPDSETGTHAPRPAHDERLFEGRDLNKRFAGGVQALDAVTVRVRRGETLGVVGESGSGKTTLARVVVGLEKADSGDLELLGAALAPGVERRPQTVKRQLQMIFQNPADALNPYMTAGAALERTVRRFERGLTAAGAQQRVEALLALVRLPADYAQRVPSELSGGERQRVGIARAFAAHPALILADEPTSALDVSVQAAILNLLKDLRAEQGTAYLFISHDLRAVSYLADRILVMLRGQIVEEATPAQFAAAPFHPFSELLLAALPDAPESPHPVSHSQVEREIAPAQPALRPYSLRKNGAGDEGQITGCPFADRCPRYLGPICDDTPPPWQATPQGHHIRCHIPLDELAALQTAGAKP